MYSNIIRLEVFGGVNLTQRGKSVRICKCHINEEVLRMFNDEDRAYSAYLEDPTLIFQLIKHGYYDVIDKLIDENNIDVNMCDSVGNDVVLRLLKARQYDLVLKLIKKKNWDVNHQNEDGDTFGHILALDNSVMALRIVSDLVKKKNYIPNIRNNKGETMFDRAINHDYICTAFKVLKDKRFNDIDIISFKRLCHVCLNNSSYGKYSRLNNLEIIVSNLAKKELVPSMRKLIDNIRENMDNIKREIMSNSFSILEGIINSTLVEATI